MRLNHQIVRVQGLLPRSRSKGTFLVTMVCYAFTLYTIEYGLMKLLGLWPAAYHVILPRMPWLPENIGFSVITALSIDPIVESVILISVIESLRKLRCSVALQVVIPLLLICVLHSMEYALWGLLVAPLFLIDIGTYLYWRRTSPWIGAQMMVILHIAYNAIGTLRVIGNR